MFDDAVADLKAGRLDKVVVTARRTTAMALEALPAYGTELSGDGWFGGKIVSNRYLPLIPTGAWRGLRVRILDDAMVTENTLDAVKIQVSRLQGIQPKDVDYDIRITETQNNQANYPTMEKLAHDLAVSFGRAVRPFFVDFAVSKKTPVSAAALWHLLHESDLTTVDVTAQALWGAGARAYSLVADGPLWEAFRRRVGAAADLVTVAKVRVFTEDSFGQISMRVAPTVLTGGIEVERLRHWLGMMGASDGTDQDDADVKAAGALVSFMLSNAMLEAFTERTGTVEGLGDATKALGLDMDYARVILGEALVGKALDPASLGTLSVLVAEQPSDSRPAGDLLDPEIRLPVAGVVRSSFISLGGDDAELAFTEIAKRKFKNGPRHIPEVTLEELANLIGANPLGASLFLDAANDAALCVPAWVVRNGLVVRAYRGSEATPKEWKDLKPSRYGGRLLMEAASWKAPSGSVGGAV
jgi:hypothetical protein